MDIRDQGKFKSKDDKQALREYVSPHSDDEVTQAMNQVINDVGGEVDPFVASAARRTLERSEK